jgi:hypothetical protein
VRESPYPKGASEEWIAVEHSTGCNYCDGVTTVEKGICSLLPETVAGSSKLVELCKTLVRSPCLLTLVVFKGLRNTRQIRDHDL